jgi:hypothetical protein
MYYGSEFINNHLVRYCTEQKITFTRSRPYRKNDNCFGHEVGILYQFKCVAELSQALAVAGSPSG